MGELSQVSSDQNTKLGPFLTAGVAAGPQQRGASSDARRSNRGENFDRGTQSSFSLTTGGLVRWSDVHFSFGIAGKFAMANMNRDDQPFVYDVADASSLGSLAFACALEDTSKIPSGAKDKTCGETQLQAIGISGTVGLSFGARFFMFERTPNLGIAVVFSPLMAEIERIRAANTVTYYSEDKDNIPSHLEHNHIVAEHSFNAIRHLIRPTSSLGVGLTFLVHKHVTLDFLTEFGATFTTRKPEGLSGSDIPGGWHLTFSAAVSVF